MYKILCSFMLVSMTVLVASTISVNTLVDENVTNGECSLREAIVSANTNTSNDCTTGDTGVDIIKIDVEGIIQIVAKLPTITNSVKIIGKGVNRLTIKGNASNNLDENEGIFVFRRGDYNTMNTYVVKGMTLRGGTNLHYYSDPEGSGGCISVNRYVDFTLDHVKLFECYSGFKGGAMYFSLESASLPIHRSKIHIVWSEILDNNSDSHGAGINIFGDVDVNIENTTISGNQAGIETQSPVSIGPSGGGIVMTNRSVTGSTFNINNSTIYGNTARGHWGGGIVWFSYSGGASSSAGELNITNSTIVGNMAHFGLYPGANSNPPIDCSVEGAGIRIMEKSISLYLKNNIIAGNKDWNYGIQIPGIVYSNIKNHVLRAWSEFKGSTA